MDTIHNATLFIETSTVSGYKKGHSLIEKPYLVIIASNASVNVKLHKAAAIATSIKSKIFPKI